MAMKINPIDNVINGNFDTLVVITNIAKQLNNFEFIAVVSRANILDIRGKDFCQMFENCKKDCIKLKQLFIDGSSTEIKRIAFEKPIKPNVETKKEDA